VALDDDAWLDARFAELYPKVLAFALRRIPDRQSAEDVAAETFAIAWRRRDEPLDAPLPWLYGVARRLIANQHRGETRRAKLLGRLSAERSVERRDPSSLVADRDATLRAFAALSEPDREILMLVAWEGVGSRDGAKIIGCTRAAFELRLFRARRRLEKELAATGHLPIDGSPSPSTPASEKA
jgi:RNA polymerase sigma-70 factor (ECF subfamily)